MKREFFRIVAAIVVPCLLVDPATAVGLSGQNSLVIQASPVAYGRFVLEAVMPPERAGFAVPEDLLAAALRREATWIERAPDPRPKEIDSREWQREMEIGIDKLNAQDVRLGSRLLTAFQDADIPIIRKMGTHDIWHWRRLQLLLIAELFQTLGDDLSEPEPPFPILGVKKAGPQSWEIIFQSSRDLVLAKITVHSAQEEPSLVVELALLGDYAHSFDTLEISCSMSDWPHLDLMAKAVPAPGKTIQWKRGIHVADLPVLRRRTNQTPETAQARELPAVRVDYAQSFTQLVRIIESLLLAEKPALQAPPAIAESGAPTVAGEVPVEAAPVTAAAPERPPRQTHQGPRVSKRTAIRPTPKHAASRKPRRNARRKSPSSSGKLFGGRFWYWMRWPLVLMSGVVCAIMLAAIIWPIVYPSSRKPPLIQNGAVSPAPFNLELNTLTYFSSPKLDDYRPYLSAEMNAFAVDLRNRSDPITTSAIGGGEAEFGLPPAVIRDIIQKINFSENPAYASLPSQVNVQVVTQGYQDPDRPVVTEGTKIQQVDVFVNGYVSGALAKYVQRLIKDSRRREAAQARGLWRSFLVEAMKSQKLIEDNPDQAIFMEVLFNRMLSLPTSPNVSTDLAEAFYYRYFRLQAEHLAAAAYAGQRYRDHWTITEPDIRRMQRALEFETPVGGGLWEYLALMANRRRSEGLSGVRKIVIDHAAEQGEFPQSSVVLKVMRWCVNVANANGVPLDEILNSPREIVIPHGESLPNRPAIRKGAGLFKHGDQYRLVRIGA